MKHARILLIIGLWMAFIPFTGIPFRWHQTLFLIAGILVVIWAFRIYITLKKTESPSSKKESFKIKKASKEEDFEDDPAIPESLQPKLELVAKPEPVEKEAPEEKKETAPSAAYIAPKNQIKKEAASRSVEEPKETEKREEPFKIKKENKEGRAATPKEAKPDRKLLTLSAMMLGRQIQKALEIERTTPRIRITKPEVRFKDIPIVIEEDDEKEEELIETISIEDEEIEVIVDEEIDTPVESFEIDTEASFTKNAVMQSDEEELPEENEVVEDDMSFLETNNEELLEEEINPENSASELFSEDRSTRLDSDLLSRLSDDFEDEEEEEEDEN